MWNVPTKNALLDFKNAQKATQNTCETFLNFVNTHQWCRPCNIVCNIFNCSFSSFIEITKRNLYRSMIMPWTLQNKVFDTIVCKVGFSTYFAKSILQTINFIILCFSIEFIFRKQKYGPWRLKSIRFKVFPCCSFFCLRSWMCDSKRINASSFYFISANLSLLIGEIFLTVAMFKCWLHIQWILHYLRFWRQNISIKMNMFCIVSNHLTSYL